MLGITTARPKATAIAQTAVPPRIRVVHAGPELGTVEVLFNSAKVLDQFAYGTNSDWLEVNPGAVRITIHTDTAGFDYVVFDAIAVVAADEDYELILATPVIVPFPVDRSPLPEGHGRIRVIQTSVQVPAADIAQQGGDVLIDHLEFGEISNWLEVPAGSFTLEVRVPDTGQVVATIPDVTVEAGTIYDIVVYGLPGSQDMPLTAVILTDTSHAPMLDATPSA
jgi:hypothetical protein